MTKRECGAKTRSGGRCKQAAMPNGRCRLHGGKSLAGIASPTYKHGRRSKYSDVLTGNLKERYEDARGNRSILSLLDEIAVVDARVQELMGGSKDVGAIWFKLLDARKNYDAAVAARDEPKVFYWMSEILGLIDQGAAEASRWHAISDYFEQRRKLVETQHRMHVAAKTSLNPTEAHILVSALTQLVVENVKDKAALAAISAGLIRILPARVSESVDASE